MSRSGQTTRVLVVEDDPDIAMLLARSLARAGFAVDQISSGADVLPTLRRGQPDLLLLDLMLPGLDGIEICRALRADPSTAALPIIMLTARAEESDRIVGLELGADDYITKPFDFEELQARIRAVLRRARQSATRISVGDAVIDFVAFTATRGGLDLRLSRREFDLLGYLAEREGRIVQRDELLREVWGFPEEPATRAVDYAIRRLRRKLEADPHNPRHIHTVHGNGYSLTLTQSR